jgi:hypothetical protein
MESFFLLSMESMPVLFFMKSDPMIGVEALCRGLGLLFASSPSGGLAFWREESCISGVEMS